MKAIIIDNEQDARDYLKGIVDMFCPEVQIFGTADGVETGIAAINENKPDFIFLDVEMDDGTGFELLSNIDSSNLKVIFTTAHDKYAIQAIRLSAIDFLLKPIDPDDLKAAVDRTKDSVHKEEQVLKMQALRSNVSNKGDQKIILKDQSNIYIVKIDDIIYCSGEGSYTTFYLTTEEQIIISKNLKVFEKLLPEALFYRTHTSYMVNMNKIKRIAKGLQDIVVMDDSSEIPISVRRKANLISKLS